MACVSRAGNSPGDVKCPAPEQREICKCPTPGLKRWANALQ